MYYLLSFKLFRRKQNGHNLSQHKTNVDGDFFGFGQFLKSLSRDKQISV
jgi:hypothetical protein